jgi:hypothetical protein
LGTGFLIYLNMAPIMWHSKKSHLLEGSDWEKSHNVRTLRVW